ncbi:MAG: MmgE/PrpD family protein [Candidatus Rokubacteria bacterium]|nr:MmgE/PrpD family protein [Candidatus Rokubacteria bacterium]
MTATARIAEFVVKTSLEDCPAAALPLVRRAALDTVGVTLAGATEPAAAIVRRAIRAEGGLPIATVIGTRVRTSPAWAALANGVAGHAHDFDDTNFSLMGHPSVPLFGAALAAAEAQPADGRAVALGYVIGFEISATLGAAVNPDHYARGWHATSTVGTIGCAAAAARIFGLDVTETRHALGMAASLASGLKENFGSMTKPYHAGHAARNGVWAALLAREGFTASDTALEGNQGYVAAFGGRGVLDAALDQLGRVWHVDTSRIAVKPYPSCALTHAAIDTLLELRERERLRADQIADVEVGVHRVVPDVLRHPRPATGLERKFSMQYCAAAALADGRVDLASFGDADVAEPARSLMNRVRMVVDASLPDDLERQAWSRVTIRLSDGRTLAVPARGAQGHPDTPLSDARLREKFVACATLVLPRDEADGVAIQLEHLDDIPDIRALTSRLATDLE